MLPMLLFIHLFVWPFIQPLVCVAVLSRIRRKRLVAAAVGLTLLGVLTAAPLAYNVVADPYTGGLSMASLSLYPAALVAMIVTLLARAIVIWSKWPDKTRDSA